ncbi:uncharacterized protein [Anas acuta]|uniref:Sushi domain-containing protein n=3 Tax=Anas TaxID=8835 RepID=A0A8B9UNM2_9AVES|nr:uncharacterized protein LOC101798065 [Anas platyrhynchos]|eukprot:XP_005015819.1 uncharacterized protein LOC101798065 isoform X1 [Anas platyrhynchos]
MRFGSCLLWRTLLFVSVAEFLTVFSGMGVFAIPSDCKSATIDDVNKCLEKYSECFPEMAKQGGRDSLNHLIWVLQESLDVLRPIQDKFCKHSPQCPQPLAPKNGGLVCVTIDSVEYCKPMCNKGYDFQFLRRSRLYETCGNTTGFSWTTQMVGGQALAVCEPSETAVSGAESAYFPANSSCLHTLAFSEPKQLNIFLKELAEQGVDISNHDKQADCLMCGY